MCNMGLSQYYTSRFDYFALAINPNTNKIYICRTIILPTTLCMFSSKSGILRVILNEMFSFPQIPMGFFL